MYIAISIFLIILTSLGVSYLVRPKIDNEIRINDVIEYSDYDKLIIKNNFKKIIIYDLDKKGVMPGDLISIDYEENEVLGERIEGGFNHKEYLIHNNYVEKTYSAKNIIVIKHGININIIKYYIFRYVNHNFSDNSLAFIKALVLGNKNDFNDDFLTSIKDNGISHLFAISGLHIGLLVLILTKILKNVKKKDSIITIFLIIYIVITGFSSSVVRSSLMFFFSKTNKKLKLGFSSTDNISIIYLFMLMISPFNIYNSGFILSFLVSFMIILISKLIMNKKQIVQMFIITLLSNLISLPIIINMNNELNRSSNCMTSSPEAKWPVRLHQGWRS